jgi:hypothetical protein
MPQMRLSEPVYVNRTHYVEELSDIESVLEFLEIWPASQRDLAFDTLQRACLSAYNGRFPIEAAAENFRRFLKRKGPHSDAAARNTLNLPIN